MIYCVDLRDVKTGNSFKTILKTEDYDEAWNCANKWNRQNCLDMSEDECCDGYINRCGNAETCADVYSFTTEEEFQMCCGIIG